jgi:hypothetical protein
VVLHVREDHHVAGAQARAAPCLGDEVERLGRVLGEHDLVGVRRVHEPGHGAPGALVGVGRLGGEAVGAAVDRRVRRLHEARHGVDDAARLLGRVRRVEVHDRCALDLPVEEGELLLDRGDVEPGQLGHVPTSARNDS